MGDVSDVSQAGGGTPFPLPGDRSGEKENHHKTEKVAEKTLSEKQKNPEKSLKDIQAARKESSPVNTKLVINALQKEGRWVFEREDLNKKFQTFNNLNETYLVQSREDNDFNLSIVFNDFIVSVIVDVNELVMLHTLPLSDLRKRVIEICSNDVINDIKDDGRWFEDQEEVQEFLTDPGLAHPEEEFAACESAIDDRVVLMGIIHNNVYHVDFFAKDDLVQLKGSTKREIHEFILSKVVDTIIEKMKDEERWFDNQDEVEQFLTTVDEEDLEGEYAMRLSSSDENIVVLSIGKEGKIHSIRINKEALIEIHDLEKKEIHDYIQNQIVEDVIDRLKSEGSWFEDQNEVEDFVDAPILVSMAEQEQLHLIYPHETEADRVVGGIIHNEILKTGDLLKKDLVDFQDMPPSEVYKILESKLVYQIILQLSNGGRWFQDQPAIDNYLTNPQLGAPEKEYAARQSTVDPGVIVLSILNHGRVQTIRMKKQQLLELYHLKPEQIRNLVVHRVYVDSLCNTFMDKNLQTATSILTEAKHEGIDLSKILREVLTTIERRKISQTVLEVVKKIIQELDIQDPDIQDLDIFQTLDTQRAYFQKNALPILEEAIRSRNVAQVEQALEFATLAQIPIEGLWQKVNETFARSNVAVDLEHHTFAERVKSHFEALQMIQKEGIHRLSPEKMLKLSIVGEMKVQEIGNAYVKKTEVKTAYSLMIDRKNKTFTILLKGKEGYGPINEKGGTGKVVSAIEILAKEGFPSRATHVVQKVNLDDVQGMNAQERTYEEKYGGLRSICEYRKVKSGVVIQKVAFIKEAFECDLFTYLQKAPKPTVQEKLKILYSLAGQLERMHQEGVMHNDIKLENALWKPGKSVLCDFGYSFEPGVMSSPSKYKGTYSSPEHSAPEMLQNPSLTPAFTQEVYAFGLLAYSLISEKACPWCELLYDGFRGKEVANVERPKLIKQGIALQYEAAGNIELLKEKQKSKKGLTDEEAINLAIVSLLDPNPKTRSSLAEFRQVIHSYTS